MRFFIFDLQLKYKKLNFISHAIYTTSPCWGLWVVYMVILYLYFYLYLSRVIGSVQQRKEPPDLMISVISTSIT